MNLRKYAQGNPCMIRLPGCSANPEETVLCHYRDSSTGFGRKEPDLIGAWGCASCHAAVDGRRRVVDGNGEWTREAVQIAFQEAIFRTQRELIKDNKIKW